MDIRRREQKFDGHGSAGKLPKSLGRKHVKPTLHDNSVLFRSARSHIGQWYVPFSNVCVSNAGVRHMQQLLNVVIGKAFQMVCQWWCQQCWHQIHAMPEYSTRARPNGSAMPVSAILTWDQCWHRQWWIEIHAQNDCSTNQLVLVSS